MSRQLVNPYAGNAPFVNNQIPTSLFTPASTKLLSLIPLPNSPGGVLFYNQPDDERNQPVAGARWTIAYQQAVASMPSIFIRAMERTRFPETPTIDTTK